MLGQGRPSSLALAPAGIALLFCAALADFADGQARTPATLPAITRPDEPPITPKAEPVRLRLTWGGSEARAWIGSAQLDKGVISDLKLLGLDADAAGSAWLERGQLRIGDLSPHVLDCVDITAEAAPDAQLVVELAAEPTEAPARAQVAIADLAKRPYQIRLDDRGNTLEIAIVPHPIVQISINRNERQQESLIFSPGEQLSFAATLALPASLHGTTVDVQTSLHPARQVGSPPLWSDNLKLSVPIEGQPQFVREVPLKQPEGVYTVRVAVSRPSGYFRDRFFASTAPLAERTFEIVVIDPRPPATAATDTWTRVLEIDPSNPGWIDRLPSWTPVRRIPGLNHGPLGNIRAGVVELPTGRFVELPPTAAGGEANWQAYTLPVEAVGRPHMLEVDFPIGNEQHFGLSILEPNAAGIVDESPRDTGVVVEGLGRDAKKIETERILFWPRTQSPTLVVTNRHPSAAARFGTIRLQRLNGALNNGPAERAASQRLVAAFVARPLIAETFGATQGSAVIGPVAAPRTADDLLTFYESATRLSEHLRYGGYNAAVVSALADGSSIFPLASSSVTPFYDSGRLANRLKESDGLELALRVFDRDGLTLIPAVQFAAPLAKLEQLRRSSDPQTNGLEWVNRDGRTWLEENGARGGLAPYYNVLDPRVQRAMLDTAAEIVGRYSNHRSFGGVAVQLTSDGYAQLPPFGWGLDDATIARFEQATGIAMPATGTGRFKIRHDLLASRYAAEWRSWRAAEMARFYGQLAEVVRGNTDRRLLLTTEKLFDHPHVAQRILPNLRDENRVAAALLELGLERQLLERTPGITLCPTMYIGPTKPLPDCANDLELNAAFARWRKLPGSNALAGAVLYHRSKELRLPSFATRMSAAMKVASGFRFICEPVGYGPLARQPYIQAIGGTDPALLLDGGDLLPLAQDKKLREIRSAIAQLPISAQISEIAMQPVVVRTYSEASQTTIVVMNSSPWAAQAQVALTLPSSVTLEPLTNSADVSDTARAKPITLAGGQQSWSVLLEPYDLQAVRIATSGANVVGVNVDLDGGARPELKAHLADFMNRDVSASRPFQQLANPGFEPLDGGAEVPGWRLTEATKNNATIQLDATAPQEGKTSLHLRNNGKLAAAHSDPFLIPATGQLGMMVFARCKTADPATELRLVCEWENRGQRDRRAAKVQCAQLVRPNQDWDPRPLAIPYVDLPLDSQATMRIVFELNGPGEIWLDNVTMYDLLFPLSWYGNSQAEKLQLVKLTGSAENAFERDQLSDCLQLLDGYWPRFVMAYRPPNAPKVAVRPGVAAAAPPPQGQPPNAAPAPPADQNQPAAPGVMDRFKRWVIPR
jgi:hypothetical protein